MIEKVKKGIKITMGTKNGIISTTLLSLIFEKKQKDNLDLIRPFVECAICKKYSVGDKIELQIIASFLEAEFGFEQVIDSVVESILERLVKEDYITLSNKSFFYTKSLDERCEKFEVKKEHASRLLNKITNALRKAFKESDLADISDESIHSVLYKYFEDYGLSLFNKTEPQITSSNQNPYLFCLAKYIIEQEKANSSEFIDIIQLYKGVLLSTVIYIQPENADLYYARFKGTTVYLDAPLVLRILGLCSEVENRKGQQLFNLLKGKVAFKMFQHSYKELCSILLAYINAKQTKSVGQHTLKYFDEKKVSANVVNLYFLSMADTLSKKGIVIEDTTDLALDRSCIDYHSLHTKLKNTIEFYQTHDAALEYDADSVYLVKILRGQKIATTIENCKAIFVTLNSDLSKVSFAWQTDDMSRVPYAISDIDLSVIMWLKEYKSREDFPKDYIISNAFGTLEALSDTFIQKLSEKVQLMESSGMLSSADVSLITENNYIQKKLFENYKGNIEEITEEDIIEERELFKTEYAKEIGMDNQILSEQVRDRDEQLVRTRSERDANYSAGILLCDNVAREYAKKSTKWVDVSKWGIIIVCILFSIIVSATNLMHGDFQFTWLTVLSIVSAAFAAIGIVEIFRPIFGIFDKLKNKLYSKRYTSKFASQLKFYEDNRNK